MTLSIKLILLEVWKEVRHCGSFYCGSAPLSSLWGKMGNTVDPFISFCCDSDHTLLIWNLRGCRRKCQILAFCGFQQVWYSKYGFNSWCIPGPNNQNECQVWSWTLRPDWPHIDPSVLVLVPSRRFWGGARAPGKGGRQWRDWKRLKAGGLSMF